MSMDRGWTSRAVSADEAVRRVASGHRVFVHGAAATPTPLVEALGRRTDLSDVHVYHLHTEGPMPFADAAISSRVRSVSFFTGPALRKPIENGLADFVPVFLSDIPLLFLRGTVPLDVAFVQLSPPDKHGFCTLGTSVDIARAAVDTAKVVVAEINQRMPRTHGETVVPLSRVASFVHTDRPLPQHGSPPEADVASRIGEIVAGLVEDRATLQVGIGAIPDAVLARLGNKHDLGVHTETFSDGLIPLMENGVVTNRYKHVYPGRTVSSFIAGTQRVFDSVDDNPQFEFLPADRTNDTAAIRRNDRVVAINSAIEVDLTGQVCADSIGHRIYSGIGGQMDFMRGAALSRGGKPVIALPSTATGGTMSRIVPVLKPGAGVVTTRGHVQWVVTEYGAVNLHGLALRERAEALISIAHPDFRRELAREVAQVRHFIMQDAP